MHLSSDLGMSISQKKIKNKKMTKKGRERNGKEKEEKNDKNIINRIETPM